MKDVLVLLIAIQRTAKDAHYHAKGDNFWAEHLLADRIYDGLEDFMDEINEDYFMGSEQTAPHQRELYLEAAQKMSDNDDAKVLFSHIKGLIFECLSLIESLTENGLTAGESDLLGRISSDLMKKNGFLNSQLR